MIRILITASILFCLGLNSTHSQVHFIDVTSSSEMDSVWQKAKRENLNVFVDIFADWCGPCKWMDANVFARVEAGNFLNSGFINVKMNGESEFGSLFARKNGLQAYPTLFLFNAEQKMMNMLVGAKPWEQLEVSLQNTLEFYPVLEVYQNKYETNLLPVESYPAYLKALRKMSKDDYALSVIEKYRQDHIGNGKLDVNDIAVIAFYVDPGTEEWNRLTSNVKELKKALDSDLEGFIEKGLDRAIIISVENDDFTVAEQFISLVPKLTKDTEIDADDIERRAHIYFNHYTQRFDELIEYIDNSYAGVKKGDHEWLFDAASDAVFLDARNSRMTEKGIEWFTECLKGKETYDYYFHLALSQYFSDRIDESLKSLENAVKFTDDEEKIKETRDIIEEIKSMI